MPMGNRGWLDQHERFPPPRRQMLTEQTVRWAKASIGTTEDADLVAQGKNLEEQVSTRAQG